MPSLKHRIAVFLSSSLTGTQPRVLSRRHRCSSGLAGVFGALAMLFLLSGCASNLVLGTGSQSFAGLRMRLGGRAPGFAGVLLEDFRIDANRRTPTLWLTYRELRGPSILQIRLREGESFKGLTVRRIRARTITIGENGEAIAGGVVREAVLNYPSGEIAEILEQTAAAKCLVIPRRVYGAMSVFRE